ncbi:FAD-dependent monooxygenase [Nocardia pseudobrasiliensis]|uniref:2-polyprenyl-6-methoxyphenol hydroxylase-like FAD-dependent oxidoreductase n=1 Tax=Nocardia pseudobrasiliensis TaxID=45979 RepID=A0A370HXI1_9NOCA|nr:FAD-dependent monooxygenase [Nocardia pseudobrasiliensis]RDI63000.1 2-polyprenyl-6-methoxyphenol hydroxylase-like FAD-dependent oxidoreductase [Nocardia pseudobrasiliensis]
MTSVERIPVLVVGGGMVGLSAALLLEYHGVPYVLVERRVSPSPLPRSRGIHTRTMEIYRQLGLESEIQRAAATVLKAGAFGGAWQGASVRTAEPLDLTGSGFVAGHLTPDASPSRFAFLPQVVLEPLLTERIREHGGQLRLGVECVDLAVDSDGVTATLREGEALSRLRADYVIAADGANSPIRRALGIGGRELPPNHHYVNVFARVDLTELLDGRGFSQCAVDNDRVRGLVLTKNNTDEWSFHIEYDPAAESPGDYPDERCVELVRAMVGLPEVEVRILARSAWDTGTFVADDYHRGRVFLAGDAAHRHAPWGGYGGNTGVSDAHNLVWKLAAVLAGTADPALLDSYRTERRPRAEVAVEQSRLGDKDLRTRYGVLTGNNAEEVARQLSTGAVMGRYRYDATGVPDHVTELTGQIGTRLPHLWIDADETTSTLDLCGPGFALLVAGSAGQWRDAAARAQRATGIDLALHALPGVEWAECTGLPQRGALLVRPDAHVAARSDAGLSPAILTDVLRELLGAANQPAFEGNSRSTARVVP